MKKSKHLGVAKKMPPLHHTVPGKGFDTLKSEVAKWLTRQPDILQYIPNRVMGGKTQSPYIKYDPTTGMWQGADYGD